MLNLWHLETGELLAKYTCERDYRAITCVDYHPYDHVLAYSGFGGPTAVRMLRFNNNACNNDVGLIMTEAHRSRDLSNKRKAQRPRPYTTQSLPEEFAEIARRSELRRAELFRSKLRRTDEIQRKVKGWPVVDLQSFFREMKPQEMQQKKEEAAEAVAEVDRMHNLYKIPRQRYLYRQQCLENNRPCLEVNHLRLFYRNCNRDINEETPKQDNINRDINEEAPKQDNVNRDVNEETSKQDRSYMKQPILGDHYALPTNSRVVRPSHFRVAADTIGETSELETWHTSVQMKPDTRVSTTKWHVKDIEMEHLSRQFADVVIDMEKPRNPVEQASKSDSSSRSDGTFIITRK